MVRQQSFLKGQAEQSSLDVIGVVREVGELGSVTSRATNKPVGINRND